MTQALTTHSVMTIVMTMVMKRKKRRLARPPATMSVSEFRAKCLNIMDRIAATGATVIITKRGVPVARAEPVPKRNSRRPVQGHAR